MLRTQLIEPVGRLDRPAAQDLVDLYRHVLTGTPAPEDAPRGLPVLDEEDPRLLEQAARADALRDLWRPALQLVEDAPEVTLRDLFMPHFERADAEWDQVTLVEKTEIDDAHLSSFLADRLELTDKTDVHDLACVIHIFEIPWEAAEPAVTATLRASPGGTRIAEGPTQRIAARSRAGADEETTKRDLFANQSTVDTSAHARAREISAYLTELRRALDDLE